MKCNLRVYVCVCGEESIFSLTELQCSLERTRLIVRRIACLYSISLQAYFNICRATMKIANRILSFETEEPEPTVL